MAGKAQRKRALLIAGPTASGKSRIALELAESFGGIIINADAMQVYRELKILSARPGPAEEARAPHRLYGSVSAAERYSAGRWLADATAELRRAWEEGAIPVVVGGTGLYFKALEEGLAEVPEISVEVRERVARWAGAESLEDLANRLEAATGEKLADRQRLIRGLEVFEETGRRLSDWKKDNVSPALEDVSVVKVYLLPERETLYRNCEDRLDQMVEEGAVEEVRQLISFGLEPELPAMKAIGVREFSAHLASTCSLEDAIIAAKTQTRRYAKRQLTWYRGQMRDWPALAPADAAGVLKVQFRRLREEH